MVKKKNKKKNCLEVHKKGKGLQKNGSWLIQGIVWG